MPRGHTSVKTVYLKCLEGIKISKMPRGHHKRSKILTECILCLEGIQQLNYIPEMPGGHLRYLKCLEGIIG